MKTVQKEELYRNLKGFLKTKGIELQDGSYTRKLEKGCGLLANTINVSQQTLAKARSEVDKSLDRMRQIIHEKTAPKPSATPPRFEATAAAAPKAAAGKKTRPKAKTAGKMGRRKA